MNSPNKNPDNPVPRFVLFWEGFEFAGLRVTGFGLFEGLAFGAGAVGCRQHYFQGSGHHGSQDYGASD